MPEVSVLVPVRNGMAHLAEATAAMSAQRVSGDAEFLMIDGGSTDGSRAFLADLCARDPRFVLLENPGRTTPRALNIGLADARGEFVARMDAHSRYPDDYLSQGIERLRRGDVQAVHGPVLPVGTSGWSRRIACALLTPLGSGGADKHDLDHERPVLSGFTGVWGADTLRALGGWDEGWPVNQDVELAARLHRAGGTAVSIPSMVANYRPRSSLRALAHQYARYGHYRAKSAVRHPATRRRAHLVCPGLVLTAAAAVAPSPLQLPAWLVLGAYGAGVAATSARAPMGASDRLALPAVFVTMHGAWGLGYLSGLARFGWRR
jgi:glycosyltransferase involved in cell wall biosynthesis